METFKWDIAIVSYGRAMKMVLHSGLKLKETRATAYQTPRLNDRWVDGCVEPIISMAFAICSMCFEKQFHQNSIPVPLSKTYVCVQIQKGEILTVLVALGKQNLRYHCFCKVILL